MKVGSVAVVNPEMSLEVQEVGLEAALVRT